MKNNMEDFSYKPIVGVFEMTVSGLMRDLFMKELGFEIEMLNGEYKSLPDDMHYYKFDVSEEKEEIIKLFFQHLVSHPNIDGSIKFMNYPVNNN